MAGWCARIWLWARRRARASLLDAVPREMVTAPEIEAARAQLELAEQAANAGPVSELAAQVDADPDDHQARYDLATALIASGDAEGAVDHLLELFRRDREWNDGAAKAQLLTIFEAAGPKDPVALRGRRPPGLDDPRLRAPGALGEPTAEGGPRRRLDRASTAPCNASTTPYGVSTVSCDVSAVSCDVSMTSCSAWIVPCGAGT